MNTQFFLLLVLTSFVNMSADTIWYERNTRPDTKEQYPFCKLSSGQNEKGPTLTVEFLKELPSTHKVPSWYEQPLNKTIVLNSLLLVANCIPAACSGVMLFLGSTEPNKLWNFFTAIGTVVGIITVGNIVNGVQVIRKEGQRTVVPVKK